MKLILLIALLALSGCVRVRAYQDRATRDCLAKHSAEQCKPLSYPSCEAGEGCR
jgi:uncharacterized ParB-like nuclease family protein